MACWFAVIASVPAWAAPLKPASVDQAAEAAADGTSAVNAPGVDWAAEAVPGTGRTMELLLEMQKQTPAARPQPDAAGAATRPAPARAATPANLPLEGLNLGVAGTTAGAVGTTGVPGTTSATGAAGTTGTQGPVLFGVTAEPAIRPSAGPEPSWNTSPAAVSGSPQRPQHASSELPGWVLLPAKFIAWLRENRYAVVAGAAAVLVVVWLASAVIGRRRYAG